MFRNLTVPVLVCVGFAACTHTEVEKPAASQEQITESQAAAAIGNPLLANKGDINAVNVSVQTEEELKNIDNGSEEDLVWTDPDHPDADIPGLNEIFENKKLGLGWQIDMGRGIQLARKYERPLIVWFHDSLVSPRSNAVGKEYLDTKEFDSWCRDRVVRVRLDSGAALDETKADKARYRADSINALQRRYGLTKKPSIAIITPSGKISARIDGFDGFLNAFARDLQNGVKKAEEDYAEYKRGLVERGYREWRSARGDQKVFGKLMRFDQKKQTVYLKESGGRVTCTKLRHFSAEDIDYLLSTVKKDKKKSEEEPSDDEQI